MYSLKFRSLTITDWEQVAQIYQQGIQTGNATFEREVPNWNEWNKSHMPHCRIVAELNSTITGWAALSAVSNRCVYGGVAEVSVYIHPKFFGQKIGTQLLEKLILESEKQGIWTLQAGIFPENIASIKIHKKLGFREIGFRERIGKMNGVWRNTILLERRSNIVGN